MKLKLKIIIPLVILIAISWIGNIYIYSRYTIDKPILIKSYLANEIQESGFQLFYITSTNDKDFICQASFPELKTERFYVERNLFNTVNHSNYAINVITVDFKNVFTSGGKPLLESISKNKSVTLSKVSLITNSGKTYEYDLGRICLGNYSPIVDNSIKQDSGMSSGDKSSTTFKTKQNVSITSIESPLKDIIPDIYDIQINGKKVDIAKYSGAFKGGQEIEVESEIKARKQMPSQYRFANVQIPITLTGLDSSGRACEARDYIGGQLFYNLTAKDIRNIIKESR